MRKFLNNLKKEKDELVQKMKPASKEEDIPTFETKEQFLRYQLLNEGKLFYIPENFEQETLINKMQEFLAEDNKLSVKTSDIDNVKVIEYKKKGGFKSSLGLSSTFQLFILKHEKELIYEIKPANWLDGWNEKNSKFNLKKFIQNSLEEEITEFITNYIVQTHYPELEDYIFTELNRYNEDINDKQKIWFYTDRQEDEILLAFLNISSIKKIPGETEINNKLNWKYVLTTETSSLIAFDEEYEIDKFYDLTGHDMSVKKSITKDTVEIGEFHWLANIGNSKY